MKEQINKILLELVCYLMCFSNNIFATDTYYETSIVAPAAMLVDTCKEKLLCCGDELAYEELTRYTNEEFERGSQLYYYLYIACRYPRLGHSCSDAVGIILQLMYGGVDSYCFMSERCRIFTKVLLTNGIQRKDGVAAMYLYDYYTFVEKDSTRAADCANLFLNFTNINTGLPWGKKRLLEMSNRWSTMQRLRSSPPRPKSYIVSDSSVVSDLRQKIRMEGDTASYMELMRLCGQDSSERIYRESLFDALMMVFRYDYESAIKDVSQILSSFYHEEEDRDELFVRIMELITNWGAPPVSLSNNKL